MSVQNNDPNLVRNSLIAHNSSPKVIPICKNSEVQTENNVVMEQYIFNATSTKSRLPTITVKFKHSLICNTLLDSGSSLCLLDKQFFLKNKEHLNFKYLSSNVRISTINSTVKYNACVQLSFKIEKFFFKHPMFLVDLPDSSNFHIILGYDFIYKNNIILHPSQNILLYKGIIIPLLPLDIPLNLTNSYDQSNSAQTRQEQDQNNICQENENIEDINFYMQKDPPPVSDKYSNISHQDQEATLPSNTNTETDPSYTQIHNDLQNNTHQYQPVNIPHPSNSVSNTHPSSNFSGIVVKNAQKTVIEPRDDAFIKVKANFIPDSKNVLFEPSASNNFLLIHSSLHSFNILDTHHGSSQCATDGVDSVAHINKDLQDHSFYILVHNLSDDNLHINKNQVLGFLYQDIFVKQDSLNSSQPNNICQVNLIQASDEVISLRKKEFSLSDFNLSHLNIHQKQIMEELLSKYFSCFSKSYKTLGHTDLVMPKFSLNAQYPVKCLPFPIPYGLHEQTKKQLHELQEAGIITRNVSEWASPLLLVKKKPVKGLPQQYRLTLDLRMVNTLIKQHSYPLPPIAQIIHKLTNYQYFSSMDFHSAFWQIALNEKDTDMLTFASPFGSFKLNRLIFGMKNSSSIFQHLIDTVIDESNLDGVLCYQDDLILASNSFQETVSKLEVLFNLFRKYNLTLSSSKCNFHKSAIDYLGFHVTNNKIYPLQSNIVKINSFPVPKSLKEIKRFLGLINFYRSLIPNYTDLVKPLLDLSNASRKPFKMTEEQINRFKEIQKLFFSRPFLIQPNFNKTFFLNTDASTVSISGIILQKDDQGNIFNS